MYDADVNGYDHNLCVNRVGKKEGELALVATVSEPTKGRTLTCSTVEPGCQLYCAGFLDGTNVGREGKGYPRHGGFCLESQKYPDAINQNFTTTLLRPDQVYTSKTVFAFGTC
jgi:aldose 1-epimerase